MFGRAARIAALVGAFVLFAALCARIVLAQADPGFVASYLGGLSPVMPQWPDGRRPSDLGYGFPGRSNVDDLNIVFSWGGGQNGRGISAGWQLVYFDGGWVTLYGTMPEGPQTLSAAPLTDFLTATDHVDVLAAGNAYLVDLTPQLAAQRLEAEGLRVSPFVVPELLRIAAGEDSDYLIHPFNFVVPPAGVDPGGPAVVVRLEPKRGLPVRGAYWSPTYQRNAGSELTEGAEEDGPLRVFSFAAVKDLPADIYREAVLLTEDLGGDAPVCSGVLVSETLIVSAAHCVCDIGLDRPYALVGVTLHREPRVVGRGDGQPATMIDCDDLPPGASREFYADGDIALYTLTEPLNGVRVRKIAAFESISQSSRVRVLGWGVRDDAPTAGADDTEPMKFLGDSILASYDCGETADGVELFGGCRPSHEMVGLGGADTCVGDSGGPAYIWEQETLSYQVAGITSRAVDPAAGCGAGGIYVRLESEPVRSWLIDHGVPEDVFATRTSQLELPNPQENGRCDPNEQLCLQ